MINCDSLRRYTVLGMGPGRGVLPGLDRGASEDLSLQALKSDAVLWKTKGTGRGTNMVLCRPGGRCFYFSLTFFPSPIRGPVVVLWLFFVCSPGLWTAVCKDAGTTWKKKEIKDLAFFFFCESILCLSGFTFLYFWILYSSGNQMDTLFLWLESSWTDLVRHTHEHAAMCWARSKDCLALGE